MTKNIAELFLNEVVEKLNEVFPEPTTQGPAEKEASNTTGGSWDEDGEILNPFIEAQRVLGLAEEAAEGLTNREVRVATLIEVAKAHTEIGKQLLDDFIR